VPRYEPLAVGYNPIEYEPGLWNRDKKRDLIHVDVVPADIDKDYRPQLELTGNIAATIEELATRLEGGQLPANSAILDEIVRDRALFAQRAAAQNGLSVQLSRPADPDDVGLPWAIAACLVRPNEKVISISGDGDFLFSAMELETAVRLKCNLVHLVWIDSSYDMVAFQEVAKYGRTSASAGSKCGRGSAQSVFLPFHRTKKRRGTAHRTGRQR
jgi:acetolactate synthase-1/2/3 large subunit